MHRELTFVVASLSFSAFGCASIPEESYPCYDGWTAEEESSRIVSPSEALLNFLRTEADVGLAEVQCVHELASQDKYIVIVKSHRGEAAAISLRKSEAGFEIIDRELIGQHIR